jgi:DNA-binding GntR family transcriptional regulator
VTSTLSPALRQLLERVSSFEKLELVIALRRAPAQQSTVHELARTLDVDRDEVRALVNELAGDGLLVASAGGEVTLAAHAGAMDELAALYDADKLVLVKAIAERAMDRLRNLAGRAFAEAFVIRKKPGGNDDR